MIDNLNLFGVAGGGGSSSGGGDGGFGLIGIMFLAGYVPMHFIGALFRKKYKDSDEIKFSTLQSVTWIIAVVYALIWIVISIFAVNSSFLLFIYLFVPAVGSIIGAGGGLYNWFGKVKQSKLTKDALQASTLKDKAWDENRLTEGAKSVFMAFQRDWSGNDPSATVNYLTPYYYGHIELMLLALRQMNRRNDVNNVELVDAKIIAVNDSDNDSEDAFTIGFEARANDSLIDTSSGAELPFYTTHKSFTEYWSFYRDGNTWRLGGIIPSTAADWTRVTPLQQFAASKGFYYSLDWGSLLLPSRGQLFTGASFATADINNHCIGWHQGTYDRILTQLYTYKVNPAKLDTYLIAQATLPRSYGNIVVRRRKGLFQSKIRNLREVSTEWQDFNKMYRVFATSPEQATSLELLNPKYMEQLAAISFEVNIEIVDNVLYIYTPISGISAGKNLSDPNVQAGNDMVNKYQMILWTIEAAFKEMKM